MRYELKRNTNGQIQQCDNADGNDNIYAKRPELRKLAMEKLESPRSGKLGELSNLQFFGFQLSSIATGSATYIEKTYNTSTSFPSAVSDCLMFGVDSLSGKALYYNVISLNVYSDSVFGSGSEFMRNPSQVTFYPLQNIETSGTSSTGTKIPLPNTQLFTSSGTLSSSFNGNIYGHQRISVDIVGEQGAYYQNNDLKGIRCSGLALSQIFVQFDTAINTQGVKLSFEIGVDVSSVSTTY